jgi:L-alanine-DL-glutamate epimerase-like enolase superfamily enzyme
LRHKRADHFDLDLGPVLAVDAAIAAAAAVSAAAAPHQTKHARRSLAFFLRKRENHLQTRGVWASGIITEPNLLYSLRSGADARPKDGWMVAVQRDGFRIHL